MITVVQNFICTIPERLELIRRNTPTIADVWGDYEFIINYNWEDNFEEVYSIYKENIPKLSFYQNLEPDWALVTRALLNEVKTPYVLFINEDQELFLTKQDWKNIWDCDFLKIFLPEGYFPNSEDPASKIVINNWGQYPSPGYKEGEHVWFYDGKFAPHKRISTEAVYRTEFITDLIQEFLEKGDDCTHDIPWRKKNTSNFYEGYYDFHNGMARFPNLKCAIAKKNISKQWDEIKQNRIHYND